MTPNKHIPENHLQISQGFGPQTTKGATQHILTKV